MQAMFGRRASCDPQPSTPHHSNFSLKRRLSFAHARKPSNAPQSAPPLIVSASTFQPITMPTTTSTSSAPPLPTTTNTLRAKERAELVRRTRKLEQVLGVAMHVVEARNSVEEAVPSASSSPGAGGAAGRSNSVSDRIEIPDASSPTSNSGHVPRRRLKSLRRPSPSSRSVAAQTPTGGVLVSTSTQVHVDEPSETTTTTVVVSPPPKESPLPWYCSPVDMDDDQDEQPDSVVVRSKQSLVFASSSQSLLSNDLPALPTPTTTTSYVFPSPMSSSTHLSVVHSTVTRGRGRDRSSSVTSTATFDSIASTSTFILPDPRQRQVNQALKLQRRLGESIPPELLQGSQQSSSSTSDLPASSIDSASSKRRKVSHKPSLSLRIIQKKKPKHQQVQVVLEPAGATRSVPEERQHRRRSHRRVHSDDVDVMKLRVVSSEADLPAPYRSPSRGTDWTSTVATLPPAWASDIVLPTQASKSQDGFEQDSESRHLLSVSRTTPVFIRKPARDVDEDDEGRRMTPKEKALNVRRAQKMTKKFGQAPPHALFQITTNNASSTKISINIDLDMTSTTSSLRRQSTTYTLSVPRSPAASSTWSFHGDENEAPTPTAESDPSSTRVRRRSSLGSLVVSSSEDVKMGLGDSSSRPSRVKSIPSPIVVEFPAGREVGVFSPTTTAVTPTTPKARSGPVSPLKLAQVFEPPAPAPPSLPLVNANADSTSADSSGAGPSRRKRTLSRSKSQSFATKRRQATKLTKFFGVEYPDLYQAMVTTTTPTTTTSIDAATSTSSLLTEEPTQKKPPSYHYQKVSAARTRKSSDAAIPSRGSPAPPPPPPSAYKKRRSVVAGLTSSDSSSLRVGVDDSCRWSAKGPEEVEELMTKLRAMKA